MATFTGQSFGAFAATALQGDTLDQLVWRETGLASPAVEAVLEANRDLADAGEILPEGTVVRIPALVTATVEQQLVQLWD